MTVSCERYTHERLEASGHTRFAFWRAIGNTGTHADYLRWLGEMWRLYAWRGDRAHSFTEFLIMEEANL